ncbi:hypothetical protein [Listeria costaricensis]|uniref:hypothetical protein n=1 Tax=Listeria costaricensis TaxID=2026604 RepID=UPI000C06DD1F|nr:hypothetical protein [Listeria costaricensis]
MIFHSNFINFDSTPEFSLSGVFLVSRLPDCQTKKDEGYPAYVTVYKKSIYHSFYRKKLLFVIMTLSIFSLYFRGAVISGKIREMTI